MLGTVTRAGRLLDLFTDDAPEWGPTAVARELDIAKSQAYELLTSLTAIGLLRRSHGGQFRLGWRTLTLGRNLLRTQFPETVSGIFRSLAQAFGEPVHLMALDRDHLEVIATRSGSRGTDQLLPGPMWDEFIARCAGGKCLLAGLSDATVCDLLATLDGDPYAADELADELRLIRRDRVAFDHGDVSPALRGVAVPIRDAKSDTLAALAIWTTGERWPQVREEMTRAVTGVGRRIERALQTSQDAHATPVKRRPVTVPVAA
jgi:DNA-binding IclR family transcriptional regulator